MRFTSINDTATIVNRRSTSHGFCCGYRGLGSAARRTAICCCCCCWGGGAASFISSSSCSFSFSSSFFLFKASFYRARFRALQPVALWPHWLHWLHCKYLLVWTIRYMREKGRRQGVIWLTKLQRPLKPLTQPSPAPPPELNACRIVGDRTWWFESVDGDLARVG